MRPRSGIDVIVISSSFKARQDQSLPKAFRGDKAGIESNQAPDAGGECRDEALHSEFSQFNRCYFLQDFRHI
jgi:hypothetical protein